MDYDQHGIIKDTAGLIDWHNNANARRVRTLREVWGVDPILKAYSKALNDWSGIGTMDDHVQLAYGAVDEIVNHDSPEDSTRAGRLRMALAGALIVIQAQSEEDDARLQMEDYRELLARLDTLLNPPPETWSAC